MDADPNTRLKQLQAKFVPFFFWMIGLTFGLVVLSVVVVGIIVFCYKGENPSDAAVEKALMAQTIQVSLGMILGLVSISFGVVMTWVAIEAPFELHAKGGDPAAKVEVSVQSISPGIVLMIGGMLLAGYSLYLPIHFSRTEDGGTMTLNRELPPVKEPPPVKDSR